MLTWQRGNAVDLGVSTKHRSPWRLVLYNSQPAHMHTPIDRFLHSLSSFDAPRHYNVDWKFKTQKNMSINSCTPSPYSIILCSVLSTSLICHSTPMCAPLMPRAEVAVAPLAWVCPSPIEPGALMATLGAREHKVKRSTLQNVA